MKSIILLSLIITTTQLTNALVINEIMSNPIGDDGGREWFEVYNNSDESVDITSLTISVKNGNPIVATPVSGGVVISPRGYAIIASVVSGSTKFTQDYSNYNGPLLKSSMSLINTGTTSLEIRLQDQIVDTVSSYTPAKEGNTLSLIGGIFNIGAPTPGGENKTLPVEEKALISTPTNTQTTLPQSAPPAADIIFYLPKEKMVVAGAPAFFQVTSTNHEGAAIYNLTYMWSFGDGGQSFGATTTHRFYYPGKYIVEVEGSNGVVAGKARMNITVVAPELQLSPVMVGKYGAYLDITNPSPYELDFSGWYITVDGAGFKFPSNTIIGPGVTHFPGIVMGFASTTISTSTIIKLLYPNMEEATRVAQSEGELPARVTPIVKEISSHVQKSLERKFANAKLAPSKPNSTVPQNASPTITLVNYDTPKKDTRLANFIRSFLKKE